MCRHTRQRTQTRRGCTLASRARTCTRAGARARRMPASTARLHVCVVWFHHAGGVVVCGVRAVRVIGPCVMRMHARHSAAQSPSRNQHALHRVRERTQGRFLTGGWPPPRCWCQHRRRRRSRHCPSRRRSRHPRDPPGKASAAAESGEAGVGACRSYNRRGE